MGRLVKQASHIVHAFPMYNELRGCELKASAYLGQHIFKGMRAALDGTGTHDDTLFFRLVLYNTELPGQPCRLD